MADIVLTGLSSSDPIPGQYAEIVFGAENATRANLERTMILVGNKLSTGSATAETVIYGPDTTVPMSTESDVTTLFGSGSELHREFRRAVKHNPFAKIYAIAMAENGSGVAGTGTVTITGPASAAGAVRVFVADEFVEVAFISGDSATTIAAALVTQINAQSHWPCTASNSAGVITLTSKQKGARANFIQYSAAVKPFAGTGVGASPAASSLFTSGAGVDSLTNVLAALDGKFFYYHVVPSEDATELGKYKTFIDTQALPINGLRQRFVFGSIDTVGNTITITTAINFARAECIWQYVSDVPPCELAAAGAASYLLGESGSIPKCNFDFYGEATGELWSIKAPLSGLQPTRIQIQAALNAGITPITSRPSGSTYLVKRCTTKFKTGSVVDYRVRDSHKVTICDFYTDDLLAIFALQFHGKNLTDDPKTKEEVLGANVVTPRNIRTATNGLTDDYFAAGLLQKIEGVDGTKALTEAQRDSVVPTRVTARVPLYPIDILDQIAVRVEQVG